MASDQSRRRYEADAEDALRKGDLRQAAIKLVMAAKECLSLASATSDDHLRRAWMNKVDEYEDSVVELLDKAEEQEAKGEEEVKERKPMKEGEGSSPWRLTAAERPDVCLDDVAGMEDVKGAVRKRVIEPVRNPEIYAKWGESTSFGVLLHGPPGTGKTLFAHAIAGELDWPFFAVRAEEIVNKWVGETEKRMAALFREAKSEPLSVVFIDEVSYFLGRRGQGTSRWKDGMVDQFLTLVGGGMDPKENVLLLVATTNRPWDIDPACTRPKRLRQIYVGLPDEDARVKILGLSIEGKPVAEQIDCLEISGRTEGYSGADLEELVGVAIFEEAVPREIAGGSVGLEMEDFWRALQRVHPSVREKDLKKFEKYNEEISRRVQG